VQGWWQASDGRWYPPEPGPRDTATAARARGPGILARLGLRPLLAATAMLLVVAALAGGVLAVETVLTRPAGGGLALPVDAPGPAGSLQGSLAPPYAGTGPAGTPVTPTVERAVLDSTWTGFAEAVTVGDAPVADSYGTPSAVAAGAGEEGCDCLVARPGPTTAFDTSGRPGYPATFLAQFLDSQADGSYVVVLATFRQASRAEPWLVTSFGIIDGQPYLQPGSNTTTAVPAVPATLARAPREFAAYFQALDTTGRTSTPLPPGFVGGAVLSTFVDGSRASYRDRRRDGTATAGSHVVVSVGRPFDISGADLPGYPGLLESWVMVHRYTQHAPAGRWYESSGRRSAVSSLPAGQYTSVRVVSTIEVTVAYDADTGSLTLLANQESAQVVSGTTR